MQSSHFAPARFLLGMAVCLIALQAAAMPKALPDAVVHAHSVFLINETGFNELGYSTVFELNKWGRFDLADSPEKADLILRLDCGNHVRAVPDGQFPSSAGLACRRRQGNSQRPHAHFSYRSQNQHSSMVGHA